MVCVVVFLNNNMAKKRMKRKKSSVRLTHCRYGTGKLQLYAVKHATFACTLYWQHICGHLSHKMRGVSSGANRPNNNNSGTRK
jgi:hypothetical protein